MCSAVLLKNGDLRAEVLPTGATLSRLAFAGRDLILGFEDPAMHASVPVYAGHLVGPVANRLAGGSLPIAGQTWRMQCNENGITTLHSGDAGLHARTWKADNQTPESVRLMVHLEDGDGGLPGHRSICATYTLAPDTLVLDIRATTTKTTPMNIAHHPYWALDADLSQTKLLAAACTYLPKNEDGIPTGDVVNVAGSGLDFRSLRKIPIGAGLDHCLCLRNTRHRTPQHAATLQARDGLQVEISTTEPGLQIYDGAGLPDLPDTGSFPHAIRPFAGIAIEAQGWPDAPHHTEFPDIMIGPTDVYRQITSYRIHKKV